MNTRLPPILDALLPLKMVTVTLRFLRPTRFHFFHQPALGAFCYTLMGGKAQYDSFLILDALESGRTGYKKGDLYTFSLTILKGGDQAFGRLLSALIALPKNAQSIDESCPFGRNVEWVKCQDVLGDTLVDNLDAVLPYSRESLLAETRLWESSDQSITLRWLSPFRIKRAKAFIEQSQPKGEQRYCQDASHIDFSLLLSRIYNSVLNRLDDRGASFDPQPLPLNLEFINKRLFWVHASYSKKAGRAVPMGGLTGSMSIPPPSELGETWLQYLILGQYLCVGERRNFGWGRYRLETDDRTSILIRAHPNQSLLAKAAQEQNLITAWQTIERNRSSDNHEVDASDPLAPVYEIDEEESDPPMDLLTRISQRLLSGSYHPPALTGYVIPKKDGGLRALAVPPFSDRIAQRAVAQVMSEMLEPFMAGSSHGYRKNRSRITAKDQIVAAYKAGYHWVYEADISAFFNNVDRVNLEHRLFSLYGDDPVVDLVLKWMAAEVEYQGRVIQRPFGIPQGSPISPLMANLMLDDLDHDLAHNGFKIIRYADDFVVLCRSKARAEQAEKVVRQSLLETGLSINPEKSGIVSFDQGFRFLGYYFHNNLVLQTSGPERATSKGKARINKKKSNYWLSQIGNPIPLAEANPAAFLDQKDHAQDDPNQTKIGERSRQGTTLFVTGELTRLSTLNSRLVLKQDDQKIADYAWRNIASVVLIGPHGVTTPALRTAMRFGVPVHFVSRSGRYQGVAANQTPTHHGHDLWLQQAAMFAQSDVALLLCREIVAARLRHQREVLRLLDSKTLSRQRNEIRVLSRKLLSATTIEQLNGYEGRGAAAYFDGLKTQIDESWGFVRRVNRHAPDPFNALLSLGYTIIYQYVDSLIRADGLSPWIGFYHQGRGDHRALASDLMEPFRHIVERAALSTIRSATIKPDDFAWNHQKDRMELGHIARKAYLGALSKRLNRNYKTKTGRSTNYIDAMHQQNLSLTDHIRTGRKFCAWRMP